MKDDIIDTNDTVGCIILIICVLVIGIFIGFVIHRGILRHETCLKAGYDGYKELEGQPFCYRVCDNGQKEYLRYEYASE